MKQPRINITQKFVFYLIIISIIPLLLVGMSFYSTSDTVLQEEEARHSSIIVESQRDYLDLQLEQIGSLIANISSVEEITNALDDEEATGDSYTNLATQARIGYILNGYSNLRGLVSIDIFSVNGVHYHVGDTLDVSHIRTDVRDDIFNKAIASDQIIFWSGIEDNVNANSTYEKVITVAKVISKVNSDSLKSELVALFLVNVRVDDLYTHLNQINLEEGAYMMVLDAENRIIYHPDWARIGTPADALANSLPSDTGTLMATIDGQKMVVSYARSSLSNWVTLSLIPLDTLTAKTAAIRNNTLMILLISFLVVGVFALMYNRNVVQPIQKVTHHFQQFQAGTLDWDKRMELRGNDEIGELVQWFNAFMDTLAARREAELQIEASLHEKEMLLQEIHHRVKNNLQVISSLLYLQSSQCDDPKLTAVFQDSQNRIRSMSLIHEKLYRSQDSTRVNLGEYIRNLTTYLIHSYQTDVSLIEMEIETNEIYLDIETAVPYGLLLNELVSNALKHAFSNGRKGKITILLHTDGQRITLVVRDNGIGIPVQQLGHDTGTLGFRLIETLAEQLDADVQIEVNQGTKFIITFDIPVSG